LAHPQPASDRASTPVAWLATASLYRSFRRLLRLGFYIAALAWIIFTAAAALPFHRFRTGFAVAALWLIFRTAAHGYLLLVRTSETWLLVRGTRLRAIIRHGSAQAYRLFFGCRIACGGLKNKRSESAHRSYSENSTDLISICCLKTNGHLGLPDNQFRWDRVIDIHE
jgi:hypothetical protein